MVLLKATYKTPLVFRALTAKGAIRLRNVTAVIQEISKDQNKVYPSINEWNRDNLGPIYIPQQGKTVALNGIITIYKKHN
jgi:signal peptidase I